MTDFPIDVPASSTDEVDRMVERALNLISGHVAALRALTPEQRRKVAALIDDTEEMVGDALAFAEREIGSVAGMRRDVVADRQRIWRALDAMARRMAPGAEREAYEVLRERFSV